MATVMRISMRVNPLCMLLFGLQVLGNRVNGGNDRHRNEANKQAHYYHEHRLDGAREALGLLLNLALIELGEVYKRGRKVAGGLAYRDHVGEHVGVEFYFALEPAG